MTGLGGEIRLGEIATTSASATKIIEPVDVVSRGFLCDLNLGPKA
jgi:hypothetical protein